MELLPQKALTKAKFCHIQLRLGWTNNQAAAFFSKTPQTISNWRRGEQNIPLHVTSMLNSLIEKHGSFETAGILLRDNLQSEWEKIEAEKYA